MNDKMTPDKERENCPCRKAIINPFDAMMMVVVRRLDKAYLELKRSKPPAKEAEFALRNAKLSFYGELVRQSIETVFSPEEIIALYENDDLAGGAWTCLLYTSTKANKLFSYLGGGTDEQAGTE